MTKECVLNSLPSMPINAETTALLVVDVQPEYWSSCPAVRRDFPDFENNLSRTLQIARRRRCKIIWVRADYRKEKSPWLAQFHRLKNKSNRQDTLVEVPCDPLDKNFGWEDFATPEGGELVIPKKSWSSTSNTALLDLLQASGINTVLVCGLITSICVQHSAFGVFEAGYRTILISDSCADRGKARHEAALALYGNYMYELVTSKELADPKTGLQMAKPIWVTLDSGKEMKENSSRIKRKAEGLPLYTKEKVKKQNTRNRAVSECVSDDSDEGSHVAITG